ncbi:MAG: hypothetical protein ACP5QT_00445 [Brevinematia bacterium]
MKIQLKIDTGIYFTVNGKVNLTKYEFIKGVIEGTFFSTNVEYYVNGYQQPEVYQILNDSFKVKRVEDD